MVLSNCVSSIYKYPSFSFKEYQATGESSPDQASSKSFMEVDDVISSDEAPMELNLDQSSSESEMNTDLSEQSVSDEDEDQIMVPDNFINCYAIVQY